MMSGDERSRQFTTTIYHHLLMTAVRLDEIPTEAFKADTETSINILNGHF